MVVPSGDIFVLLGYSGGKGYLWGITLSSTAPIIYSMPEDVGWDSESEVWQD